MWLESACAPLVSFPSSSHALIAGGMTEDENAVIWKFDKRQYGDKAPPRNLEPPPAVVDNYLVRLIIAMINEVSTPDVSTECFLTPPPLRAAL